MPCSSRYCFLFYIATKPLDYCCMVRYGVSALRINTNQFASKIIENVKVGFEFSFCTGKVMGAIVATLNLFTARDCIKFKTFCDAVFGKFESFVLVHIKQDEIKASSAPHRTEIHHVILIRAVAHHGGEKMLYGVHCGDMKIVALIRLFEA